MPELANSKPGAESDLERCKKRLIEVGYDITVNNYRAEDFGSLAVRPRLFIRGALKKLNAVRKLEFCHMMMNEVKFLQINPEVVFGHALEDLLEIDLHTGSKGACNMKDPKFLTLRVPPPAHPTTMPRRVEVLL